MQILYIVYMQKIFFYKILHRKHLRYKFPKTLESLSANIFRYSRFFPRKIRIISYIFMNIIYLLLFVCKLLGYFDWSNKFLMQILCLLRPTYISYFLQDFAFQTFMIQIPSRIIDRNYRVICEIFFSQNK